MCISKTNYIYLWGDIKCALKKKKKNDTMFVGYFDDFLQSLYIYIIVLMFLNSCMFCEHNNKIPSIMCSAVMISCQNTFAEVSVSCCSLGRFCVVFN